MSYEEKARELTIILPVLPPPIYSYVPAVRTGNLVYASGQTPQVDGVMVATGKVGAEISIEQAQELAALCAINSLAAVKSLIGSLDNIVRIVKVNGSVASAPGFGHQPTVINGASQIFEKIFGEAGKHARAALGVAELPLGAPVELEIIVEVKPEA